MYVLIIENFLLNALVIWKSKDDETRHLLYLHKASWDPLCRTLLSKAELHQR